MESTAKVALLETGRAEESIPKADFGKLINEVSDALGLRPDKARDLPDSRQAIRQVLAGARQIAVGLAEFRNSFGTGHGPARTRTGLTQRHARLALNAATLWCELILDTLADPQVRSCYHFVPRVLPNTASLQVGAKHRCMRPPSAIMRS
jgi:hypothetical protein